MDPMKIGVVGCGNISKQYFRQAARFDLLDITACADLNPDAAQAAADEFGVTAVMGVDDLLAGDEVEAVLNLTIPAAHVPVGLKAIAGGKHVYSEKPLGVDRDDAAQLLDAAKTAGLHVGNAPDTFLGTGQQTARRAIDEGLIGRPLSFTAFMMGSGHESWHPSPEFYYKPGGGPMFDMGPYYLTAIVNLFGPVAQVAGFADIKLPLRTITHGSAENPGPLYGQTIDVETPDHYAGTLITRSGVTGTVVMSFACHHAPYDHKHPITVYGSEGAMKVPDPNGFDAPVLVMRLGDDDWREVACAHPTGYGRAVGLADMAQAIRAGRESRCSGALAWHVLDVMQGFLDSGREHTFVEMSSTFDRPAPMPTDPPPGLLDD